MGVTMVDANTYLQAYITVGSSLLGIWGLVKVIKDVKKNNDDEVKRRTRWDNASKIVEDNFENWNKGLADIYSERDAIVKQYNERLDEQDGKIQELLTMIVMIMRAQNCILEALIEQGIGNGEIRDMHKEMNTFITEQIGK